MNPINREEQRGQVDPEFRRKIERKAFEALIEANDLPTGCFSVIVASMLHLAIISFVNKSITMTVGFLFLLLCTIIGGVYIQVSEPRQKRTWRMYAETCNWSVEAFEKYADQFPDSSKEELRKKLRNKVSEIVDLMT